MRWLLRLYPHRWRQRYGAEYLALLEELHPSPRVLWDALVGALDARAHPSLAAVHAPAPAAAPVVEAVAAPLEPPPPRPRPFRSDPSRWESWIDRQIREAAERGAFDDLPGAGKPQALDVDSPFSGEWAMAFQVVKQAGETLPWIALRREIDDETRVRREGLDRTAAWLARLRETEPEAFEPARARARRLYLEAVAKLDKKILQHNALVPAGQLERLRFPAWLAEKRFDEAIPL